MAENAHVGHRERLRQRFAQGEDLGDEAILELLLCYAIPQRDVRPLAQELMAFYGSLHAVINADLAELCGFAGIKQAAAVLIRLVGRIGSRLHSPQSRAEEAQEPSMNRLQAQLDLDTLDPTPPAASAVPKKPRKPTSRAGTGLFSKALLAEAVELLPAFPDTELLSELRHYLRANLPFSAEETRTRNSNYILRRLFPQGYADVELRRFAVTFVDTQELRDVCFYRFCTVERLMYLLIEELIVPAIGSGSLPRSAISEFLHRRFPDSKSVKECVGAAVDALVAVKAVRADRTRVSISLRDVPIPSLAFIIHSEFATPGMYAISELESNQAVRNMLWQGDQLLPALYEMRNLGLIAKVSEIDNVRQFTTRYTLAQVVGRLAGETAP